MFEKMFEKMLMKFWWNFEEEKKIHSEIVRYYVKIIIIKMLVGFINFPIEKWIIDDFYLIGFVFDVDMFIFRIDDLDAFFCCWKFSSTSRGTSIVVFIIYQKYIFNRLPVHIIHIIYSPVVQSSSNVLTELFRISHWYLIYWWIIQICIYIFYI